MTEPDFITNFEIVYSMGRICKRRYAKWTAIHTQNQRIIFKKAPEVIPPPKKNTKAVNLIKNHGFAFALVLLFLIFFLFVVIYQAIGRAVVRIRFNFGT
jgi:hypothetical protein